ncbi:DUF1648 domain-containing protein [Modestobacter sp. VKM Ac-2985]|uniref:DUF1648 domain-containing protein n=1 Tax=Modestobacter sp. VKM Ac-2985 TaxID=3004139 RepID=UPI0022AB52FD|nr:DUF1648 domain-containing protein [Modestobacter sp. VKM Ac-2985]MCZ2840028.1 DUF1648 domain-containing protein [Modestobacter sp. VKM Ac-2985]
MSDDVNEDRNTPTGRSPFRRAREVAAVALPLAVWAAGAALVAAWRPELPTPVAVHWGPGGDADGFADPLRTVLLTGVVPVLGSLVTGLVLRARRFAAQERRLVAGSATGISVFCVGLAVGSIAGQRGLADPAAAPSPTLAALVAGLLAVLGGVAAARLLPAPPRGAARASSAPPETAPRLPVAEGERAVWSRRATMGSPALAALGVGGLVLGGLVLVGTAPAPLLLAPAVMLGVGLLFGSVRVWVDERGLTVRSPLGRPSWQVPLTDVAEATVVDVRPMREFGGWGYRVGRDGRRGVVLRGGPALEVVQGDGRRFVVTVPGAGQGAALLNTLATRQHS